jgi:3-oxoacyl-[acyl-carrier-protein] synthase II
MGKMVETRRVVVTGLGPVSCLGIGKDANWSSVSEGRSGIRHLESLRNNVAPMEALPVQIGGEVWDFEATEFMNPKEAKRTDRVVHYAMAAAQLAWKDAGEPTVDPTRTGVLMASGIGGLESYSVQFRKYMENPDKMQAPSRVSPFIVPQLMPNASAGHIAMHFGFTGPNLCIATACAAGTHGVGEAYRWIKFGLADTAIAGGTEAQLIESTINGMARAQALSRNPDAPKASRPFDRDRDGFVLSEGAGALILEEADQAVARGAQIYAEVAGYGLSADAYHIVAPHPEGIGAVAAMQMALQDAEVEPTGVDYINAHGTSTELNDLAETRAVKKLFGDHAYNVPISSTKSMHGHLLGAAGALEAAIVCMAMEHGVAPPTINYDNKDEECDLDYVPNEAREVDIKVAMSNSFAFGGQNASLVFKRFEP